MDIIHKGNRATEDQGMGESMQVSQGTRDKRATRGQRPGRYSQFEVDM